MNNFHPKHRGKVVGLLDASFSAGPALVSLLYGVLFKHGHEKDEQNQDLKGFYLTSAIAFGAVGLLGTLFLRECPYDGIEKYQELSDDIAVVGEPSVGPQRDGNLTGFKLLKQVNFHFLFWPYLFCAGLQLTFQTNITAYLKSYDLEQYSTFFTTMNPISGVVSKFIAGFISDKLLAKVPRIAILFAWNIFQTIVLFLCIFFSNNLAFFVIANLAIGMPNGALWCLTPTMLSEFYGMKYFGRNWGTIMFGNAFGGLLFQRVFGWIYDSSIPYTGQTNCYGLHCFTWSFVMMAVLSACSCLLNVGILESELRLYKTMKSGENADHIQKDKSGD